MIIWFPVLLLFTLKLFLNKKNTNVPKSLKSKKVSVIIPVFNAEKHLNHCLNNLKKAKPSPYEIILVDGGSRDNSMRITKEKKIKILSSSCGRGMQIKKGVLEAEGDICLVLHADHTPDKNIIKLVKLFDESSPGLSFIEILNDIKTSVTGISFGDQGQFFLRKAALEQNIIPDIRLMEDVEISMRMKKAGKTTYIWSGIPVSPEKWLKSFHSRFFTVITLLIRYVAGKIKKKDNTKDLYLEYYNTKIIQ
jgi:glycosyltransferase involved in cell wall biosynthesis